LKLASFCLFYCHCCCLPVGIQESSHSSQSSVKLFLFFDSPRPDGDLAGGDGPHVQLVDVLQLLLELPLLLLVLQHRQIWQSLLKPERKKDWSLFISVKQKILSTYFRLEVDSFWQNKVQAALVICGLLSGNSRIWDWEILPEIHYIRCLPPPASRICNM